MGYETLRLRDSASRQLELREANGARKRNPLRDEGRLNSVAAPHVRFDSMSRAQSIMSCNPSVNTGSFGRFRKAWKLSGSTW